MSYQVPQNTNKDKIFIVNRSEIKGRLDPKMALYNRNVQSWSYPKVRLKDLLLSKPQYGAAESGITRNDPRSPRYIRITDIDEYGLISHNDLGATANTIEDQYILHENDLLIARSGATVGKAYIHKDCPYTCFFAGYLIRFIINPIKALPDYIFAFTQSNTYKEWVNAIQRPSGQPNINAEEYQSLEIPLPPPNIQNEIVSIIQTAYSKKQEKESEAKNILNSIDSYVLNELGIIMPESKTDLIDRVFYISYNNLTGKRLDPKKYSLQVQQLLDYIIAARFETRALKSFVRDSCSGDWGIEESDTLPEGYTRCLTLRATEIDNQYNLNVDISKVKFRLIKDERLEKMNLSDNDIIIEKSGGSDDQPVGRVAIIDKGLLESYTIAFSNFLMKIKVYGINPDYLYCFLKTMYNIGVTDSMQSQTNGIRNLILDEFLSQPIVVPPIEKQQEIVDNVYAMREKAKTLQEEGKRILELAKQEVEQRIVQIEV